MGDHLTDGADLALRRRLSDLADVAPGAPADLRTAVRVRARRKRRRQRAVQGLAAVAVVAVLAPLPRLLPSSTPAADRLVVGSGGATAPPERVVRTFTFPSQGTVAELLLPDAPVVQGVPATLRVRLTTERGRAGGVDVSFSDGSHRFLSGTPQCTPDAGPTVVELSLVHVFRTAGPQRVKAAPQVITGCRDGLGTYSTRGLTVVQGVVDVAPAPP